MIVVGRDLAIGRSLEVLLQAAGYDTRFQLEPALDTLGELLAESSLLLILPGLSAEFRNALTEIVTYSAARIPMLELVPANGEEIEGIQGADAAPWPCPMEELQQRIQEALLAQN